ncbi:MAG: GWxTD domain-containing protein [Bacteroidetes bacterium]|nr:GWxTD domain-containing protein [Bacteroidota bacterium]
MKKKIPFFCLVALTLAGCLTINKLGITNLASLYKSENNFAQIEYIPFHLSDFKSRLYYRLNLSGLTYRKMNVGSVPKIEFKISYELFNSFKNNMLIDSGSFCHTDSLGFGTETIFCSDFEVKTVYPDDFILHITLTDVNSKLAFGSLIELHKMSSNSQQNYLVLDEEGKVIFENYLSENQYFTIKCNTSDATRLHVRCYFREFPVSLPPFLTDDVTNFSYGCDSAFSIPLVNGETPIINLTKEAFYHFQLDTLSREGLTLFRFYDGFPDVIDPVQMMEPLRYITTKKEYDILRKNPNTKVAVDSFWISMYSDTDRARIMIQRYYSRVEEANHFFSSYQEGWRTDRGIIYIIFGSPNIVYRYTDIEKWIYGEEGNFMSITFIFVKVDNPFTGNDYMIEKSENYKEAWYMAVNNWRR